jgi:RNA polymerase sigma-70 factor (ECF subfamily)
MLSHIEDALERIEPIDCEILALRHLEELGNDEAAEILGLKKAAASNRYVRALRRLREALANIPGYEDHDAEESTQ